MTWATSQHSWERSRQSRALLGTEHGAEGLAQAASPATEKRNAQCPCWVGWGCGGTRSNSLPLRELPGPTGRSRARRPDISRSRGSCGGAARLARAGAG